MKVIKNINNNVALCSDNGGKQVIVFGKGVGFIKPQNNLDLAKIERTFYDFSDIELNLIENMSSSVFVASLKIVKFLEKNLKTQFLTSSILGIADHINFAIYRKKKSIKLNMSIYPETRYLYPKYYQLALKSLNIIEEETGVVLDSSEANGLALHYINNNTSADSNQFSSDYQIIRDSVYLIENEFNFTIDPESFNYLRFSVHLEYLVQRTKKNFFNENSDCIISNKMFETISKEYKKAHNCALKIRVLFEKKLNIKLTDEELVYLILHINRLCSREI